MTWTIFDFPKNDACYQSFPSICGHGKQIFAVWRIAGQWSVEIARSGSPVHHDVNSWVVFSVSEDNGLSWSDPVEIFVSEKFGVNDPAISYLKDGTLLVRVNLMHCVNSNERLSLEGRLLNHRSDLGQVSGSAGTIFLISKDFGKTWQNLGKVDFGELSFALSREPIIELQDGTLCLSVYESTPFESEKSHLVRSWNGTSWRGDSSLIARDTKGFDSLYAQASFNEASIIEVSPNHLLAMVRCDETYFTNENEYMSVGGAGYLHICESYNNGLSWGGLRKTDFFGQPASLAKDGQGHIYCAFGRRKIPYSIDVVFSNDLFQTHEILEQIDIEIPHWDFGYPSIHINSEKIFVIFYNQSLDGTRFIQLATKLRESDV